MSSVNEREPFVTNYPDDEEVVIDVEENADA
jgi:hypothetical protein